MKNNNITPTSKILLTVAAILLTISLFVPIWSIYLDAPQYPEGLSLKIWANKIAGDVDIINGLNHYIGMKTLHNDDFIEFTILPYIIVAYVLFFLIAAYVGKRKWLYTALGLFVLFGVVAMVDFWMWEYNYGHNLDPNAAIKVPGMAYQPPLIGFKQLLNFGAYSIPNIGGWLIVAAGVLLLIAIFIEIKTVRKAKLNIAAVTAILATTFISSCTNNGPTPINYHQDACDFCKMTIAESRFAAELITSKGRVYKFDDLSCLLKYAKENTEIAVQHYYVGNFDKEQDLINATMAFFVKDENLHSPMGGNIAAFANKETAENYATKNKASITTWNDLDKATAQEENHNDEHSHQ